MSPQPHFDRLALLAVVAAWLASATSPAVLAQTARPPEPAKAVPLQAEPAPFLSALDGYKPYGEEKMLDWRQANDTTARIGGWRAYAKEAAGAEPGPDTGLVTSPAKP